MSRPASELAPKNASVWYNRGVAYRLLGQPAKSLADFSKAIELDPKNGRAWGNRAAMYMDLGQPAKARAAIAMS